LTNSQPYQHDRYLSTRSGSFCEFFASVVRVVDCATALVPHDKPLLALDSTSTNLRPSPTYYDADSCVLRKSRRLAGKQVPVVESPQHCSAARGSGSSCSTVHAQPSQLRDASLCLDQHILTDASSAPPPSASNQKSRPRAAAATTHSARDEVGIAELTEEEDLRQKQFLEIISNGAKAALLCRVQRALSQSCKCGLHCRLALEPDPVCLQPVACVQRF
jgi:hypothetical protein